MMVRPYVGFVIACLITTASAASSVVEINITVVAGHSPVYRWVDQLSNTFISSVEGPLQDTNYVISWDEQYSGALSGVGDELETLEEGPAEIGIVPSIEKINRLLPPSRHTKNADNHDTLTVRRLPICRNLLFDAPTATRQPTPSPIWHLINIHRAAIALAERPYPPLPYAVPIDHPWPGAPGRAPTSTADTHINT